LAQPNPVISPASNPKSMLLHLMDVGRHQFGRTDFRIEFARYDRR